MVKKASQFLNHKYRNAGIILLTTIVLLIVVFFLFLNSYLTPKLSDKLKSAVLTGSEGLYQLNFSKAELHLLRGNVVLYDVVLKPDTRVFHSMQLQSKAPAYLYQLKVKQILISNAQFFNLYFHKKLEIGEITIEKPELQLSQYNQNNKQPAAKDNKTIYQKLSKSLRSVHVGLINLNDIRFTYKTFTGTQPESSTLQHTYLKVTDLLIDSATQYDKSRTLFCKEVNTRLEHFSGTTANGLYQFKFRSINLSTRTSRLTATGLTLLPLPATIFFSKTKLDRFNLYLDSVSLNNINFESIRNRPDLDITRMTISKGRFDVYSNPNAPAINNDRRVTFPNWIIGHMKSILNVDTFDFDHLKITYTEFNETSEDAGTVSFDNTKGRFLHISNKKENVAKYPESTVKLSTFVLGNGKFDLDLGFSLNDSTLRYHYTGHLGALNLKEGNPVFVPLVLARVSSGNLQSFDFNVNASQTGASGKFTLLYNNLKIDLLGHNYSGYSKRPLISIVANAIVLKSDNPDKNKTVPRIANINYFRPAKISFFKSLWLTILAGVKPSAGVGTATISPVKSLTKKEQRQQARSIKNGARKAKREEKNG